MQGDAEEEKWKVVQIEPSMLHIPHALADRLGIEYVTQVTKELGGSATIVSGERTWQVEVRQSVLKLLEVAGRRKQGLLVILDEAQNLVDLASHPPVAQVVKETLGAIHKGTIARPIALLTGGLANTSDAFDRLGVSCLHEECEIDLGPLSAEAERAVIRDWLVKDGGANARNAAPWIDAIAARTDCWPHHIVSYSQPISHALRVRGGTLTDEELDQAMAAGRRRKLAYYRRRCNGLEAGDVALLGALVTVAGMAGEWERSALVRVFRIRDRTDEISATEAVDTAIQKGLLASVRRALHIPIPSMAEFLRTEYDAYKAKHPELAPQIEGAVTAALRPQWHFGRE